MAKTRRKWFELFSQKGVRKVTMFVAIFHSIFFFSWGCETSHLCGELCIFPVSAFSIFF